jgi:hypothetical protein
MAKKKLNPKATKRYTDSFPIQAIYLISFKEKDKTDDTVWQNVIV